MTAGDHLKAWLFSSTLWALFYLGGGADYYRQYSDQTLTIFFVGSLIPFWLVNLWFLTWLEGPSQTVNSIWLALWEAVIPFLYDVVHLVLNHGQDLGYLRTYWFLTAGYFLPLVILPPTGVWLDRRKRARLAALAH
jgi:hypothetical protein